jgi:hypothetical protein
MNELQMRIEILKKLSIELEDIACLTENKDKEHNLIDNTVNSIDDLRYYYEKEVDMTKAIDIDEGFEYAMGIRENIKHRLWRQ